MKTYEDKDIIKLKKQVKRALDKDRYQHTLGVMYTAAALAMAHGEDVKRAMIAGLLHDCAKCIDHEKKYQLCERYKISLSAYEKSHPVVVHPKLGAYIARKTYGINDQEILSAIRWHTTGKGNMTRLEKIVYIADYIEPWRCKAPDLEVVRRLAFADLDLCMYEISKDTLEYLQSNQSEIDEHTLEAYEYYKAFKKGE